MTDKITKILKRWDQRRGEISQWFPHFEDLARVMVPRRMGFTSTLVEGERRTDHVYDGTPMQAARGLANAIGGMLRPQGIPEIKMKAEDDDIDEMEEAKDWFEDSQNRMKKAFSNPKARYLHASGEKDLDLVVFGTAVMFQGESQARSHLLFQTLHLKDATPCFNDDGAADGMFRKRNMPVRHLAERFGESKLSDRTREVLKQTPDKKIEVLHAVLPRENYREGALLAKNLPFMDIWIELEAKHELAEGGFHEFPFIVPRWDTSSGEDMGRSPGMIALPDADTLQSMGETILIAGQRAADPPLAVPNDGSFDAINTFPGGLAYYDIESAMAVRGSPFFPIESGTNLPITRDMQADTRNQIWAAFFRNVLNLPVQGPQMTATEIIARKKEFIREMGPVAGRLDADDTALTVERAFMLMLRANAFRPIPKILQGRNIRFEYESTVKRIEKQIEASAAKQWAAEIITLGQVKPEAMDLINVDELGRFTAEADGVPRSIVNGKDTVEAIREQRAEAMAAQQKALAIQQMAEVAKTGAEAADKAGLIKKDQTQRAA